MVGVHTRKNTSNLALLGFTKGIGCLHALAMTRVVQYSSLILTGQMMRDDALERLKRPAYDPGTIDEDFEYIATKLGISVKELRGYHEMPLKTYKDYKNREWLFDLGAQTLKAFGVERAVKR